MREGDDIEFLRMMIRFRYEFVYRLEPPPNFYLYHPEHGAGPTLTWRDVRYAARLEDKGYLVTSADCVENRAAGGAFSLVPTAKALKKFKEPGGKAWPRTFSISTARS